MKKTLVFLLLLSPLFGWTQTKVIAHRGYWQTDGSAQNSVASLLKADSIGCFGSEFDVYLTADNGLVVHHDSSREGVSMITDSISKITSLKLKNGENVPTLQQYFDAAKELKNGTRLVLEIKPLGDTMRDRQAATVILKLLKEYGLLEQTDIISFSKAACLAVIEQRPETRVFYLNGDLYPFELKELGFAGLDYEEGVLYAHPGWIRECHLLGMEANVWTVNKEEDMRHFIEKGADYITTNEPVLLQQIILGK